MCKPCDNFRQRDMSRVALGASLQGVATGLLRSSAGTVLVDGFLGLKVVCMSVVAVFLQNDRNRVVLSSIFCIKKVLRLA